ncbi:MULTISPECIES: hypothetical protein [Nitratiruptor]|uniref:Uncharacterized protein n=1 Tax=Nitratiruptor tergarcus DSM 16512 TaxID=1069081 RepID=A0A1W1WUK1_9BACT|nr:MULTISPECIES: hypothetical protein [Nitratiruptor]BCD61986.1 hypothetical protein NitYY0813_C0852 [Nitratiruptor sp. YY08-13]BCD65922.1 hypothetical protein NitYY0826_C0854 [Nitratiruptor sp. YY08-26]SMC09413.1 hypothetical protein SAMN05660197_1220 [Nitratiruptor tergarcus DSM 16512]
MKSDKEKLDEAEFEIEELAMQLADMLGAALHYAGVPDSKMAQAVEAYLNGIDEVFGDDLEGEMGYEEVIKVIEHLKKTRPELFRK